MSGMDGEGKRDLLGLFRYHSAGRAVLDIASKKTRDKSPAV